MIPPSALLCSSHGDLPLSLHRSLIPLFFETTPLALLFGIYIHDFIQLCKVKHSQMREKNICSTKTGPIRSY